MPTFDPIPADKDSRDRPMRASSHAQASVWNSQTRFVTALAAIGGIYILLIIAMLAADISFTTPKHLLNALAAPEIQYSARLSLISSTITMILSVWVAIPLGYLLSRYNFRFKGL